MMSPSYQTLFINLAEPTRRGTANATYLIAWDVGIGAACSSAGSSRKYPASTTRSSSA